MKTKTHIKAGKLIGDTFARFTHATGMDRLAEKYTEKTGRDCGCDKRRVILDKLFPF
ncbi:MAG: hypothetical protein JW981_00905 [Anaerolineae bacterium]|nr:hypothetical protein [Anaerolineae bacterium]